MLKNDLIYSLFKYQHSCTNNKYYNNRIFIIELFIKVKIFFKFYVLIIFVETPNNKFSLNLNFPFFNNHKFCLNLCIFLKMFNFLKTLNFFNFVKSSKILFIKNPNLSQKSQVF